MAFEHPERKVSYLGFRRLPSVPASPYLHHVFAVGSKLSSLSQRLPPTKSPGDQHPPVVVELGLLLLAICYMSAFCRTVPALLLMVSVYIRALNMAVSR